MSDVEASAIPPGIHSITPHLVVRDTVRAIEWYTAVLGAEERGARIAAPGGKLMHAELWFGDSAVMLADEFPEIGILSPLSIGDTPVVLALLSPDADAIWERALASGATERHPMQDQFWGDRQGQLSDPFGHVWNIGRHVREVAPEDMARAAAAMFDVTEDG
jgi:PhnB protein